MTLLNEDRGVFMCKKMVLAATTYNSLDSDGVGRSGSAPTEANPVRIVLSWVVVYTVLSYFTGGFFMGDSVDYATAVYDRDLGINEALWEFGHLFWRPLGWILLHTLGPLIRSFTGTDPRIQVIYIFVALNWLAGLCCVLLLRAVLGRFSIGSTEANFGTLTFVFSLAFLNYIHSGTSYIPGLAFLLLGFYLLAVPDQTAPSILRPVWAACALAFAVCLWFPFVFAVPGALATPLFYRNNNQLCRALTMRTTLYCLMLGLASYGLVLASLGIFTPEAVFRWITVEGKEFAGIHGPTRAIFGLARSFINMGEDGVLFKRFLLHDPYNPVTILDLIRVSIFKLFLFYALLFVMLKQLLQFAHRRIFWLFLIAAAPVIAFALLWQGGDMERYLPLYPAFFIAFSCALTDDCASKKVNWLATTFLIVCIFSNFGATSRFVLRKEQQAAEERVKDVLPLSKPGSRLVLCDIHDELENFRRSFPFNSIVRAGSIRTYPVLNPGTVQDLHWHQDLARVVLNTWGSDGDIWISKRVLELRPHRNWNWVEGADPHGTWSMIHSLFTQFDYGRSVGGKDGFLLLLRTENNEAIISSLQYSDTALLSH